MDLDLRQIVRLTLRWWWLLLLAPLIAGTAAYWSASRHAPLYSATTTLLINPAQESGQQDLSGIQAAERLSATYQRLVATDPVLTAVAARFQPPPDIADLRDRITASAVTGTQLLKISVSDSDPGQAAAVANAAGDAFAAYVARQNAELTGTSRQALDKQVSETERQIANVSSQLQTLESGTAVDRPETQSQLATLRVSLNQLQSSYGDLLLRRQEMELNEAGVRNRVAVWEQARVPVAPYAPRTTLYTLLALVAGLLIAACAVALLEFLDNTVKASADFPALVGAPLLAAVGNLGSVRGGHDQLFVVEQPQSNAAEAVRLLRTNLEFAAAAREITTLAVTSPGPGEGKSTVTANLAVAMTQAGFTAIVVDADLRRPSQHRIFGVRGDRGLTSLLTHPDQPWRWAAVDVGVPNLLVIPSGPLPPNPGDLLTTDRFQRLLAELKEAADIVIVDTPPILAVSDPLVVATKVDGVALVCRSGQTRIDALRRAAETLQQGSVRFIGVVLNRETGKGPGSYYYYGDYTSTPQHQAETLAPQPLLTAATGAAGGSKASQGRVAK